MSKLIVFDVDGTFLDSLSLLDAGMREYSRSNGLPNPDIEAIKHGYGAPLEHDFGWGLSREEQRRHLYAAFDFMDEHAMSGKENSVPQLFAGATEAFTHLKDLGHTLAIITSKSEAPLRHVIEHHDLDKFFSSQRHFDDIKRRNEREKPHPDMLHSVMRELKFAHDETAMIGDSTMDIRMGRAAQTSAIGVTWGAHPKHHLMDAGAHHIAEKELHDLTHILKKIFG